MGLVSCSISLEKSISQLEETSRRLVGNISKTLESQESTP